MGLQPLKTHTHCPKSSCASQGSARTAAVGSRAWLGTSPPLVAPPSAIRPLNSASPLRISAPPVEPGKVTECAHLVEHHASWWIAGGSVRSYLGPTTAFSWSLGMGTLRSQTLTAVAKVVVDVAVSGTHGDSLGGAAFGDGQRRQYASTQRWQRRRRHRQRRLLSQRVAVRLCQAATLRCHTQRPPGHRTLSEDRERVCVSNSEQI
jgi:hypothetical protein